MSFVELDLSHLSRIMSKESFITAQVESHVFMLIREPVICLSNFRVVVAKCHLCQSRLRRRAVSNLPGGMDRGRHWSC